MYIRLRRPLALPTAAVHLRNLSHWVKDSFVKRPSRIRDMTHGHDSYLEISRDLSADEPCADVCGFEAFSREQYGGLLQFVRRRMANEERSEEHTSELQSLMRSSYAVFCLKKKKLIQSNT